MTPRELVTLKLELEFGVAPVGRTLPPATTNAEGQPRLLVSRFGGEWATFFRHDLPAVVRERLDRLGPGRLFADEASTRSALAEDGPCDMVHRLRWYMIERLPGPDEYRDVVVHDGRHVIVVDGAIVSWARTDCEIQRAAEVSIETLPDYRGRGYARQVAAAWAAATLTAGKVAFYSHLLDNAPSAAVAASLGLIHLSDEVEYL